MKCTFFLIAFLCLSNLSNAQDTLWAQYSRNDVPFVYTKSNPGESVYSIARKYSVPPGFLSDLNGISLQQQISPATTIKIPIGSYNYRRVHDTTSNRPLFYRVREGDKLYEIARSLNTSLQSLQQWNKLSVQEIIPGQILLTGWISYEQYRESSKPPPEKAISVAPAPIIKDTISIDKVITAEELSTDSMQAIMEKRYYDNNGRGELTEEAGAAAFFESDAPAKPGIYYAFHNTAERGDLIKVHNPDGDKTIYVKVIGKIPKLKEYHNCIIAISDKGAKALGTHYRRTFCKISY